MLELKTINIKVDDINDIFNYQEQYNVITNNYIIPTQIYSKLLNYLNINSIGKNMFISYIDILVLIYTEGKTNKKNLQKIHYDYINIIDNLINFGIIKLKNQFEIRYNADKDDYSDSTPNIYEVLTKGDIKEYTIIIDDKEDNNIDVRYLIDDLGDNAIKTLLEAKIYWREALVAESNYVNKLKIDNKEKSNRLCKRVNNIFKFMTIRRIKTGNKVDRLYSSFTSLSSVACKYIHIDGELFHELDISNAQPLLLALYLKVNDLPVDDNYIKIAESGKFYESLMDAILDKGVYEDHIYLGKEKKGGKKYDYFNLTDRNDIKELSYRAIFFNLNKSTKILKVFKELYPLAYESLVKITNELENNNVKLASELQNLEFKVIIKESNFESIESHYFTKHDAVLFTNKENKELYNNQLKDSFNKYDIYPTINHKENNSIINKTKGNTKIDTIKFSNYVKKQSNKTYINIIELYINNKTSKEIEEILNINRSTVTRNIRKYKNR